MIYHNTPVAPSRPPSNQFLLNPSFDLSNPVIAIITATNNPRKELLETATTVFGQSLQNFVWIIVDDHTSEPKSLDLLASVGKDPRVHIVKNTGNQGLPAGRNVGIDYALGHYSVNPPKYFVSLDDDDLFEFTALEKTTWMLESNPDWDLGGFRYIKWGASNETVMTGLHSGVENYKRGNFVPNAAVYTSRALLNSRCRYDEQEFGDGGEDWDFWMCLADHGHWGGSILEPLYWCVSPLSPISPPFSRSLLLPTGIASTPLLSARNDGATPSSTASKASAPTSSANIRDSETRGSSRRRCRSGMCSLNRWNGRRRSRAGWRSRTSR
jgi:hypothetical protein